jgi:hypothetical protein
MNDKKRVSVSEILADVRSGLDDRELMAKYGLSRKQLEEVYRGLVESGGLTQAEVDARKGLLDDVLEFEDESFQESPQAGTSKDLTGTDRQPLPPSPGSVDFLAPPPNNWQKKATLGIIGGIAIDVWTFSMRLIGEEVFPGEAVVQVISVVMGLVGWGLQIWGCYYLVKGKGYHGAFSILGALSCLGLIIVLVLPNKYAGVTTSGIPRALVVYLVAIAFLGIILAIAIPYYYGMKRHSCDLVARSDVGKLAASFELLGKELAERNLRFDNDAIARVVEGNALRYMVGPYYGFGGCTRKCAVLIRINRHQDKWVIEGSALKGTRPEGWNSRYAYRAPIPTDRDLPATIATDVANAQNGKSRDWNSHPYASPGQPEICYTESIIQEEGPPGNRTFSIRTPIGVPCSKFEQK